jgi:hypothetical protein
LIEALYGPDEDGEADFIQKRQRHKKKKTLTQQMQAESPFQEHAKPGRKKQSRTTSSYNVSQMSIQRAEQMMAAERYECYFLIIYITGMQLLAQINNRKLSYLLRHHPKGQGDPRSNFPHANSDTSQETKRKRKRSLMQVWMKRILYSLENLMNR